MPQIFPKKVVSFSSESKEFPASNLLMSSSFNKWRSEKGGTCQEVVELDFGEPVEISRLDIGNNGSAFVEVLVRRSASTADAMVFLPCSSFMSPVDAKNETNLTRVRVFSGDQLYDIAAKQKWDIFRIVCTQPFNKTLPYGLSFVSFHTPGPKETLSSNSDVSVTVGGDDSGNDSATFRPGALFEASKCSQPETEATSHKAKSAVSVTEKLRAAQQAALRNHPKLTSSLTHNQPSTSSVVPKHSSSTGSNCVSTTGRNSPQSPSISIPASIVNTTSCANPTKQASPPTSISAGSSSTSKVDSNASSSRRRRSLSNVVFSLSGYQNPKRGELRQKALDLGAKFRQDWDSDCTHLICAFSNTPKFKQVAGKGIIVSEKWIEKCYDTKSQVDWRPFRVGRAPSPKNIKVTEAESEDSDSEGSTKPNDRWKLSRRRRTKRDDDEWVPVAEGSDPEDSEESDEGSDYDPDETVDEESNDGREKEDDEEEDDDDEVSTKKQNRKRRRNVMKPGTNKRKRLERKSIAKEDKPVDPEDEDTDDEIQRIMTSTTSTDTGITKSGAEQEVSPQPESNNATQRNGSQALPDLPDFFSDKHFFVHNKAISPDEERLIQRLVVAFAGTLHQYMHPDVQYVITRSVWNEEFDNALGDNPNLIFVRPDWIFACDEHAKRVPFQKYLVVG